jgi:MFS family permease
MGRAYVVWSVGLLAYLVGVMQRTSFGVAGLAAVDRFGATPAVLSGFVVLQLLVYAVLQVPAGVLLDRFGAKALVAVGALLMAAGQAVLAVATVLPVAIAARVLVGAGDAFTFISVLSVLTAWFPARRVPMMTQLTGLLGQLGQVLSAVPLAAILHGPGWTAAFLAAAALGVVSAVVVLAVYRASPPGTEVRATPPTPAEVLTGLRASWREPGTRLGLFAHIGTHFPGTVFGLLWGVPYLVAGQGMSPTTAGLMLTLLVAVGILAGPAFGSFVGGRPWHRTHLVLTVIALTAAVWGVVLLVPPPAPLWLLVLLVVVVALGPPASMIGFDFARTSNPRSRQGTAVGIVNVGGFAGSLLVSLGIGLVLDALGGYTPGGFRVAWLLQFVFWVIGAVGVLVMRRRCTPA